MACPICSKPPNAPYAPFCSKRCADVDLSRWLKGGYAIPGSGAGEGEDEGPFTGKSSGNNDLDEDA